MRTAELLESWVEHPMATPPRRGYGEPMRNPILGVPSRAVSARAAWQLAPLLACCGAFGLFLTGCSTEPESHVVSAPPPPTPTRAVTTTTVVSTPAMVSSPTVVVANPGDEVAWAKQNLEFVHGYVAQLTT